MNTASNQTNHAVIEFTGSYVSDRSQLRYREEVPSIRICKESQTLEQAMIQVDAWNRFFRDSIPGNGYYAAAPSLAAESKYHEFIVFADDAFTKGYLDSLVEEDVA